LLCFHDVINPQKLRDGANINRSLLALANCINALGKIAKTGAAYVRLIPFVLDCLDCRAL
jgi:hypothetical protein